MDTSIVLSILSIIISLAFAIFAAYFSNKSDKTLVSIQEKINVQHDSFMKLIQQVHADFHDYATNVLKLIVAGKVHKGELSSEEADDFEDELNEALQEMEHRLGLDSTSVLSKQSKIREREGRG